MPNRFEAITTISDPQRRALERTLQTPEVVEALGRYRDQISAVLRQTPDPTIQSLLDSLQTLPAILVSNTQATLQTLVRVETGAEFQTPAVSTAVRGFHDRIYLALTETPPLVDTVVRAHTAQVEVRVNADALKNSSLSAGEQAALLQAVQSGGNHLRVASSLGLANLPAAPADGASITAVVGFYEKLVTLAETATANDKSEAAVTGRRVKAERDYAAAMLSNLKRELEEVGDDARDFPDRARIETKIAELQTDIQSNRTQLAQLRADTTPDPKGTRTKLINQLAATVATLEKQELRLQKLLTLGTRLASRESLREMLPLPADAGIKDAKLAEHCQQEIFDAVMAKMDVQGAGANPLSILREGMHFLENKQRLADQEIQAHQSDNEMARFATEMKQIVDQLKPLEDKAKAPGKEVKSSWEAVAKARQMYLQAIGSNNGKEIEAAADGLKQAIGTYNAARLKILGDSPDKVAAVDTTIQTERVAQEEVLLAKMQAGSVTASELKLLQTTIFSSVEKETARLRFLLDQKIKSLANDATLSEKPDGVARRTRLLEKMRDSGEIRLIAERNVAANKLVDQALFGRDVSLGRDAKTAKLATRKREQAQKVTRLQAANDNLEGLSAREQRRIEAIGKQIQQMQAEMTQKAEARKRIQGLLAKAAETKAAEAQKRAESGTGKLVAPLASFQAGRLAKQAAREEQKIQAEEIKVNAEIIKLERKIAQAEQAKLKIINKTGKVATKKGKHETALGKLDEQMKSLDGKLPRSIRRAQARLQRNWSPRKWLGKITGTIALVRGAATANPLQYGRNLQEDRAFYNKVMAELQAVPGTYVAPDALYTGEDPKITPAAAPLTEGGSHATSKPSEGAKGGHSVEEQAA